MPFRDLTPKGRKRIIIAAFVIMVLIFVTILIGFAIVVTNIRDVSKDANHNAEETVLLAKENTNRIREIQESRIESCKRTYQGIREVIQSFYPPPPRTQIEQNQINDFESTVVRLRQGCFTQTKPESGE